MLLSIFIFREKAMNSWIMAIKFSEICYLLTSLLLLWNESMLRDRLLGQKEYCTLQSLQNITLVIVCHRPGISQDVGISSSLYHCVCMHSIGVGTTLGLSSVNSNSYVLFPILSAGEFLLFEFEIHSFPIIGFSRFRV